MRTRRDGITAAVACALAGTVGVCADTIVPMSQDRFTSVQLDTDCAGRTSDGESARGFESFESIIDTQQQCDGEIFASAIAHQTSSIGGSSMSVFSNAPYYVQSPGSVFVSAISSFRVTFELPTASRLTMSGILLGDGQVPGVETLFELTTSDGEVIFGEVLNGPFPVGEATELEISEILTLEPGVYIVFARALAADAIDIATPPFAGESALNVTIDVAVLGDLSGDEVVNVLDLLALLSSWGPCPPDVLCPADLDGDGDVNVADLLILLSNWG